MTLILSQEYWLPTITVGALSSQALSQESQGNIATI
jgi:hypothetical protein